MSNLVIETWTSTNDFYEEAELASVSKDVDGGRGKNDREPYIADSQSNALMGRLEEICGELGRATLLSEFEEYLSVNEKYLLQANKCQRVFGDLKSLLNKAQAAVLLEYEDEIANLDAEIINAAVGYFTGGLKI